MGGGLGVIAVVRSERGEWQERHHFVLLFNKSISVFLSAGGGQSVSRRERESERDIVQKHLSYYVLLCVSVNVCEYSLIYCLFRSFILVLASACVSLWGS